MIKAKFRTESYPDGSAYICEVHGHAYTGLTGNERDMVCSGASMLVNTLLEKARHMESRDRKSFSVSATIGKGEAFIRIDTAGDDPTARMLDICDTFVLGFRLLQKHYGKYVQVTVED